MKSKEVFVTFFFFVGITLFTNCSDNSTNSSVVNQSEQTMLEKAHKIRSVRYQKLIDLAETISHYLAEPSKRITLKARIENSKYVENILEATEFFNDKFSNNILTTGEDIEKGLDLILKSKFVSIRNELKHGEIDIYFPVKEHRKQFMENPEGNIYVAAVEQNLAEKGESIIAYDLLGKKVELSPKIAPIVPTLVITYSEKRGNYMRKNFINSNPTSTPVAQALPGGGGDSFFNFDWKAIYVKSDYDGWFGGDMEIYLKFRYMSEYANWTTWLSTGSFIVEAGVGRDINTRLINLIHESYKIEVEIWEEDGGFLGDDDFVAPNAADPYWDRSRLISYPTQYSCSNGWRESNLHYLEYTYDSWGVSACPDIQLMDGPIDHPTDIDILTLRKTEFEF